MKQQRRVRGESRRSQKAMWDWRKRYRFWDAGRRIFLYPENWLGPDSLPPVVRCLAGALRRTLYRVNLASIVSKYSGETEKNLKQVFDAVTERSAVLFFDEATALFGKRTEIKDANNYFLQRIERYRGPTIVATGKRRRGDDAFLGTFEFFIRMRPARKRHRPHS